MLPDVDAVCTTVRTRPASNAARSPPDSCLPDGAGESLRTTALVRASARSRSAPSGRRVGRAAGGVITGHVMCSGGTVGPCARLCESAGAHLAAVG